MKKRLPRKEKKYAKQQGGYYQYSLCLYCRHNIEAGSTSVKQPNGSEKEYIYKMFNISPAQPKRASQSVAHTRRLKKISQYAQILLYQERARTLVRAHKRESAINNVQINIY